ncbi:MAG TPA: HlyD family efflux transporter periplasmic adaptor subunit [Lacipirellulaceae bacterium]|nr:HlyD family efflux transporter periplasmic adaptor subunit [Lacipirellulaceae bacterium]
MSTSGSSQSDGSERPDAEQVERAKREIQGLVQEIADLSRTQISPAEFYDAMLNKVVAALAAPGGAVWTLADAGNLQLAYQINLRETGLVENPIGQAQHGRLLHQVLASSEGALVAPHSGAGEATDSDEDAAANPTEFLLVLAPVLNDQGPQGVVEVFQRPGARITTQRGYLRFLLQICEYAGDFLKGRRLRHLSEKQTLWEQLESFTRTAHEKLDVRQTAYTIVNEGRRLIGCDRVSVAIRRGGSCPVEAVSGQDTFDKRSNVTVLLSKLAAAVAKTGEDVWYTGDTSNLAPQVEQALDAYVDESHTKSIAILPLKEPRDEEARFTSEGDQDPAQVIGVLLVEQMVDSRSPDGFLQRVEVVRTHSATALTNALEYEGLFLMPLWRFLGRGTRYFRGRALPKTLAILGTLAALIAFFSLYPKEFKLEGDGKLRPVIRQNVWAEINGDVQQVLVEHDDPVKKGQLLIEQHSDELEKQIKTTRGDRDAAIARLDSLNRELMSDRELTAVEKSQKFSELGEVQEKIKSLNEQMALLEKMKQMLKVRSPIDGRVVTWNVSERLQGRPVNRGENLLEIADPTGDWELEVYMPEYRMGHIADADARSPDKLPVTFFLATNPQEKLQGLVEHVDTSAEVRGESGNTVLVRVSFDQEAFRRMNSDPKIGATATAKIHCGQRAIGYVLFHDLIDFVRRMWFRFF